MTVPRPGWSVVSLALWVSVCGAPLWVSACGGLQIEHSGSPQVPHLIAALPSGADKVVHVRPISWSRYPSGEELLAVFIPRPEQQTFVARFGVPIEQLEELIIADYLGDRITILRGLDAKAARGQLGDHYPSVRAAALDPRTLVVRQAGPAANVVEAMRRGRGDPSLLDLSAGVTADQLVVYVPHALALPPRSGIGALLSQQTMFAAHLSPVGEGYLRLFLDLRGTFPPGAERNFRHLVASLAADPLGERLGLAAAQPSLVLQVAPDRVHITLDLAASRLVSTLSTMIEPRPPG